MAKKKALLSVHFTVLCKSSEARWLFSIVPQTVLALEGFWRLVLGIGECIAGGRAVRGGGVLAKVALALPDDGAVERRLGQLLVVVAVGAAVAVVLVVSTCLSQAAF